MAKTKIVADPRLSAGFPALRAARIVVTLSDGRVVEQYAPCRKGDPEAPLSNAHINDKFTKLSAPVIGAPAAAQLPVQLWRMERLQVADLRLTTLYQGA
ncbi:MAG: hypothetical protein ACK5RC_05890 [Curvibacter sp.]|nr:MmgE/PrpD family protein [Curvibacter sp.]